MLFDNCVRRKADIKSPSRPYQSPTLRTKLSFPKRVLSSAIKLKNTMRSVLAKPMSKEAKAHLAESLNTLSEALKAPLQRAGV